MTTKTSSSVYVGMDEHSTVLLPSQAEMLLRVLLFSRLMPFFLYKRQIRAWPSGLATLFSLGCSLELLCSQWRRILWRRQILHRGAYSVHCISPVFAARRSCLRFSSLRRTHIAIQVESIVCLQYAGKYFTWYWEKRDLFVVAAISSVSLLEVGDVLVVLPVCRDFQVFPRISYDGVEYLKKPPTSSQNNFSMQPVVTRKLCRRA